jgi:dipeptidyl aminopeptidase/acylaminoacyl peptidase
MSRVDDVEPRVLGAGRPVVQDGSVAITAPYGSWTSPITAADLARGEHPVQGGCFVGHDFWWSELVPPEGGRYAVLRRTPDGTVTTVLPAPWNARTRVHEYGGGAWAVTAAGGLVFANFADQRLYRLDRGAAEPLALTPEPSQPAALRYADLRLVGRDEVWCVRETHAPDGTISRDLAAVPLDGAAATSADAIRSVVSGSHFLAAARVSPDGRRLAWIAWEHPQMPWDGTELRVGELSADGIVRSWSVVAGSTTESVLQPEWADDEHLYLVSDRSGWWNLCRADLTDLAGGPTALCPMAADFGVPLWNLDSRTYGILPDGRLATIRSLGVDTLGVLDPATGELADLDLGDLQTLRWASMDGTRVVLRSGGARSATALRSVDVTTGDVVELRRNADEAPDPAYLPEARPMTFRGTGGRDVHAIVYPPHSPDFRAPEGELPPYVAFVHGGPTAHVSPLQLPPVAYLTSRGIGVVDVNYGGSTGYGREYRERLRGRGGIVDVEDTVAALLGLADAGLADRGRLAIEGGSAGGWTVLSALTTTDVFACGVSYFGVAELLRFAATTHDFESRYLDGLIGPLPEARELYDTRAPVNNVDGLSCPVLLLQGLDDPIVPPSQAEMFRDALVRKGIPHAYRAYEGESHGFRQAETIVDAQEAALSFYGQVMGFEPPGVATLELWQPPAT